jgi:hypothetical protein
MASAVPGDQPVAIPQLIIPARSNRLLLRLAHGVVVVVGFDPLRGDNFSSAVEPIKAIRWQSGTIPQKRGFAYHLLSAKRFTCITTGRSFRIVFADFFRATGQ